MPSSDFLPGKGIHVDFNDETADWLTTVLNQIGSAYIGDKYFDEEVSEKGAEKASQELQQRLLDSEDEWEYEKDKFGRKVYAETPIAATRGNDQVLRVTLVLTQQDALKLDIRVWYKP